MLLRVSPPDDRSQGVAAVDSGIATHDDLRDSATNGQRIDGFVDFLNQPLAPVTCLWDA